MQSFNIANLFLCFHHGEIAPNNYSLYERKVFRFIKFAEFIEFLFHFGDKNNVDVRDKKRI